MKLKQVLIIIFALVVASFIGYNFRISQIGSFQSIIEPSQVEHHSPPSVMIEPGSGVEAASYIIFKDDEGWIYVKNGDTGAIDYQDTDASTVINWAINQLTNGGKIFIKAGTYANISLSFNLTSSNYISLIGEEEGSVIFTSSESKMIDIENTEWQGGGTPSLIRIENIKFEHTSPDDDSIILDLLYSNPILRNVRCVQQNFGDGIAFKIGPPQGSGKPVTWIETSASYYNVGYNLTLDHITLIRPYVSQATNIGFFMEDASWFTLYSPEVWWSSGQVATLYPYRARHIGKGVSIYSAIAEGPGLDNAVFTRDTSEGKWNEIVVYGFDGYPYDMTLADSGGIFNIISKGGNYLTENSGTEPNCINSTWIEHGLAGNPSDDTIILTIKASNYINSTCYLITPTVIATNSTHFQIGFYLNNNGTITAVTSTNQRDIYWTAVYKP